MAKIEYEKQIGNATGLWQTILKCDQSVEAVIRAEVRNRNAEADLKEAQARETNAKALKLELEAIALLTSFCELDAAEAKAILERISVTYGKVREQGIAVEFELTNQIGDDD